MSTNDQGKRSMGLEGTISHPWTMGAGNTPENKVKEIELPTNGRGACSKYSQTTV